MFRPARLIGGIAIAAFLGFAIAMTWWLRHDVGPMRAGADARSIAAEDFQTEPSLPPDPVASHSGGDRAPTDVSDLTDAASVVAGHVLDEVGAPVEGGEVSWCATPATESLPFAGEDLVDAESWLGATVTTTTDKAGRFTVRSAGHTAGSAIVWVTKPGFAAQAVEVDDSRRDTALSSPITLVAAAPIAVLVVDSARRPVAHAAVTLGCSLRSGRSATERSEASPLARALLRRHAVTDELGRAELPRVDGGVRLIARAGAESSVPWSGEASAEVVLVLGPGFDAFGNVTRSDGGSWSSDALPRITCFALVGSRRQYVATTSTTPSGAWSLASIPLGAAHDFLFVLEGGGCAVDEKAIERPAARASVRIDFEAVGGYAVSVRVVDESGAPVDGATAIAEWQGGNAQARSLERLTRSDGLATIEGLPDETIRLHAVKRGYVRSSCDLQVWTAGEGQETWPIVLRRGGVLRGRCSDAASPVESFDIVFYEGHFTSAVRRHFEHATEGRFEIEGVPLGSLNVMASSDDLGQSDVAMVEVSPDQPCEIEIPLLPRAQALGRVIDGASGLALPSARVQLWSFHGGAYLAPRGAPIRVGPDGTFESDAFTLGTNRFEISAPGYSTLRWAVFANPGDSTDVGDLALSPAQDLRVQITSDAPLEVGAYLVYAGGPGVLPQRTPGLDGCVVFANVTPGIWDVIVALPGGSEARVEADLVPGRPWHVRVPVDLRHSLSFEVVSDSAELLASASSIEAAWRTKDGSTSRRLVRIESNRAVLGVPEARDFTVSVYDANGLQIAGRQVARDEVLGGQVRIELGTGVDRIRVIDGSGQPIAAATLGFRFTQEAAQTLIAIAADADGIVELNDFALGPAEVFAYHPTLGFAGSQRIELVGDGATHDIVLDPVGRLEVRAIDRETPLPGVEVKFTDPRYHAGKQVTDSGGIARSHPFAAGDYRATVDQLGYWPASIDVRMQEGDAQVALQVRRLGSLEVRAASASGVVADLALVIESEEFGVSVAEWIASGRVSASSGAVALDSKGELRLDGLPNGDYAWRALRGGQVVAAGNARVPPRDVARVDVVVP